VTDRPSRPVDHTWKDAEGEVSLDMAPPTRMAAFFDGANPFFSIDREVAEELFTTVTSGKAGFDAVSRAVNAFVERAVHHLTAEAGIRQFLVTGCKLSGEPDVHDLAQAIAPECRIVYLVVDPMMLALAHTLRSTTPEGATAYVQARFSDPEEILRQAAATLDLSQPVGVVAPWSLAYVRRDATAYRIAGGLMDGVGPGSYLVVLHHASDHLVEEHAEMFRVFDRLAAEGKTWGVAPRSHSEMTKFFDGLELVEPGVAPIDEWRAEPDPEAVHRPALYGAVGRKP
jgi:S-adenosyl methyltransferase